MFIGFSSSFSFFTRYLIAHQNPLQITETFSESSSPSLTWLQFRASNNSLHHQKRSSCQTLLLVPNHSALLVLHGPPFVLKIFVLLMQKKKMLLLMKMQLLMKMLLRRLKSRTRSTFLESGLVSLVVSVLHEVAASHCSHCYYSCNSN